MEVEVKKKKKQDLWKIPGRDEENVHRNTTQTHPERRIELGTLELYGRDATHYATHHYMTVEISHQNSVYVVLSLACRCVKRYVKTHSWLLYKFRKYADVS